MAKQRQSVQKRIREQKKREREQRKHAKATAKAERRKGSNAMTEAEYDRAMIRIKELMDTDAKKDSPEGEELDLLSTRVEGYEREHNHLGDGQGELGAIE